MARFGAALWVVIGVFVSLSAAQGADLINEGFDDFHLGSRPVGWIFTNCNSDSDTFTSPAGYWGNSLPSLRLDAPGDIIVTPPFTRPDSLTFWTRGHALDASSSLLVMEYYAGGSGYQVVTELAAFSNVTGVIHGPFTLRSDTEYLDFTFVRWEYGELALDDLNISILPPTPVPTVSPTPIPSATPTPQGFRTASPTPSPSPTSSPSATPTPAPSASLTPTPISPTPSGTPTPYGYKSPTSTPTPPGFKTPSPSPSPSITATPPRTPTPTPTPLPGIEIRYSTYLGGHATEYGNGICLDSESCAYVTGYTSSSNFPTKNPYQSSLIAGWDVFICKLSSSCSSLIYSTFLGGSWDDEANAICLDAEKQPSVTGVTSSSDFPTQNSFQASHAAGTGGETDAFIFRLSSSGSCLIYSTYLGGSYCDAGWALSLDGENQAYAAGYTQSADFPTQNAYQAGFAGGTEDGFVCCLSSSGSSLIYSTYLGGGEPDSAFAIVLDSDNCSYVTGTTESPDFSTVNAYQASIAGDSDVFIIKLSSSASSLIFSTYLGGWAPEGGYAICLDSNKQVYVGGDTLSTDFPLENAYQTSNAGYYDIYACRLDSTGSSLTWSTYFGGESQDAGNVILLDSETRVQVIGSTWSLDFPTKYSFQSSEGGFNDAFVGRFSSSGSSLACSTYLGGNQREYCWTGAIDSADCVYMTGGSFSSDFPTKNAYQTSRGGTGDAFIAKLQLTTPPTPIPSSSPLPPSTPSPTPWGYRTPSPTPSPRVIYSFPLDSDPGWSRDSDWGFGQPAGAGGEYGYPDPTSGHTGNNVYGYNLNGDYLPYLSSTFWLTTPALNCSQVTRASLRFRRWLNIERSYNDHACIEVSSNGSTWNQVWQNPDAFIVDCSWSQVGYDISPTADGQSAVYIRWGIGTTDSSWQFSGWNIDDIEILGDWTTTPTPTPSPIIPIPTPTASATASISPTSPPSPTPSPSPTATVSPVPTIMASPAPSVSPTPTPSPKSEFPRWIHDYNGDGTSDIAVFHGATGLWSVRDVSRVYFGVSTDDLVPGDYNGDGTTDIAVFRSSSGLWVARDLTRLYYGASTDKPVAGDYDGDGCCDAAVYRGSSGLWAIRNLTRLYYGASEDQPLPGFYDVDGTKDIAVFRPSSGLWVVRDITRIYFGSSLDETIPGDYDSDGAWEAAVFRASSGLWSIWNLTRIYFGSSLDLPLPADYNGDARDDMGIFREASGLWAVRNVTRAYFGSMGEVPVTR